MFPESLTAMEIRLTETRRLLAATTSAPRAPRRDRRRQIAPLTRSLTVVSRFIATVLADSREPFRTKELELASYGVVWSDEAADRVLALELRGAAG